MLAVNPLSKFRWSHNWAVMLSRWPCLLHPCTSVGRGRKRTRDIVRKELGTWAPMSRSIWLVPSSVWVGEVWSKHGLKWLQECAFTCCRPISPLWIFRNSASAWMQMRKVGTVYFLFIYFFAFLHRVLFFLVDTAASTPQEENWDRCPFAHLFLQRKEGTFTQVKSKW